MDYHKDLSFYPLLFTCTTRDTIIQTWTTTRISPFTPCLHTLPEIQLYKHGLPQGSVLLPFVYMHYQRYNYTNMDYHKDQSFYPLLFTHTTRDTIIQIWTTTRISPFTPCCLHALPEIQFKEIKLTIT